ncbi:MAG: threonine--tRNA ligase, partial [Phycisphaeraceae bacterium]
MRITLPDGSIKDYADPVSPAQVAAQIGPALAKAAIGAKVNGELWDLNRPIEQDAHLAIVTRPRTTKKGLSKGDMSGGDPDALYLLRHSTAHVMAEAIQRLWPEAQLAYGPPLDNGFYYDIYLQTPISSDDFAKIESQMANIVAEDRPFTRYALPPEQGMKKLAAEGNKYKIDNAQRALDAGAKTLSWYVTGEVNAQAPSPSPQAWEDLCMGPHVPSTGCIGAFKVMSVASSHWHGDVNSDRFQRVYGTAFFTRADLDQHLQLLEQARQHDHRVIGQKLGLFTIDEQVGQGLVLWKPRGAMVRTILQEFLQKELLNRGYDVVYTPHIGKIDLYKTSGHYPYFADSQYPPIQMRDSDEQYLLRPM